MIQQHVYTPSQSESLSQTIVYAVAEAKGVDPVDLTERLYDCVDPDALDRLFDTGGHDAVGSIVFTMAGCKVRVENGQAVVVGDARADTTELRA